MQHYHQLLYISHGTGDETTGLKQALSLARNNKAPLHVLVVCPAFPKDFPDYRQKYEASLLEEAEQSIEVSRRAIDLNDDDVTVTLELVSDTRPVPRIIQHVMEHGIDLVIKEAESRDQHGGFKAMDMDLLRKCPCAVWLCRPIEQSREHIQVAVAIDPEVTEPEGEALSLRMLELSRSLADHCSGQLHVISCWEYEFEGYLRHNKWVTLSDADIIQAVNRAQQEHRAGLNQLMAKAGITEAYQVHHIRGEADEAIPDTIRNLEIDVLVMGTMARAGIPGLIIGNTAENIMQQLPCSLLALKPRGFVSPVKMAG